MAENIFTRGEGLPGWGKAIIFIGGGAVVVLVGFKIYKGVTNRMKNAGNLHEKKDVKNALDELNDKGIKPTMQAVQYSSAADKIHTAMDGYGTDESTIYDAFAKMVNDADILSLMNAYGIRTVSSGKLNSEPDFKGTLAGAISNELDAAERKVLNDKLAKKGIKYTF